MTGTCMSSSARAIVSPVSSGRPSVSTTLNWMPCSGSSSASLLLSSLRQMGIGSCIGPAGWEAGKVHQRGRARHQRFRGLRRRTGVLQIVAVKIRIILCPLTQHTATPYRSRLHA